MGILKPHSTVQKIAKKYDIPVSSVQKQLKMGIPIEHEHTTKNSIAKDIALQHLGEIPKYYTKLKQMERSAKPKDSNMKEAKETLRNTNPCWKGYKPVGTKKKRGKTVPNCVPVKEASEMVRFCPKCNKPETRGECKYGPGIWDMFSRPIALGGGYTPNTPHPGNFPESKQYDDHEHSMARSELATIASAVKRLKKKMGGEGNIEAWVQSKITKAADYLDSAADYVDSGEMKVNEESEAQKKFDRRVNAAMAVPITNPGLRIKVLSSAAKIYPGKKTFEEFVVEASAAWQRKAGKRETGGLNQKGVESYRKQNPGSKLKTAVTTEPSKLKKGGKAWNRRKSFCSRMSGMKKKLTSKKTANDPNSRINKSLRAWNC